MFFQTKLYQIVPVSVVIVPVPNCTKFYLAVLEITSNKHPSIYLLQIIKRFTFDINICMYLVYFYIFVNSNITYYNLTLGNTINS